MESWPFAPWISALIARSPSAHAKKHLEYLISKTNANNMIYLIAETRLRMIMGRQRWRATEWQTTNKVVSERRGVRNSTILHFYKSISPQVYILQSCSSKLQIHVAPILHSTIAIFVPESTMPFGAISLVPTSANTQTVPRQRLAPKMSKYRNTRGRQRGSKENWLFAYSRTIANSSLLPVFTFIAGIVRIEIILIIYQHDDHQHNHDQTDVGVVGY